MVSGVRCDAHGSPGPAQEVQLRHSSSSKNEVDRRIEISYCHIGCGDGGIVCSRLMHLWRTGRGPVTPNIDQIYATSGDVVHPRDPFERKIECRFRWLGRTMDEQQSFLRLKLCHLLR